MFYDFPKIEHIDDVLPAIEGRDEFIIFERDNLKGIDYKVSFADTFPEINSENDALRRECRGLLFHLDGTIAARRYHKFFNINERPETQSNNIDLSLDHVVLDKLDGSMVSPVVVGDKIIWTTMMGETDIAKMVYPHVTKGHIDFIKVLIEGQFVPIFEFYNGKNRIVVSYDQPFLTLTGIRNNITGQYMEFEQVKNLANHYGIDVVQDFGSINDMDSFIGDIRNANDIEGRVVCFANGHRVKLKCDWYVRLHKAKDAITFEKDVWDMVINNNVDDILPSLDKEMSEKLVCFSDKFNKRLASIENELHGVFNELNEKADGRKEFAAMAFNQPEEWTRYLLMNHYTGKRSIEESVTTIVQMATRSSTYVEEVAKNLNLPRWSY